MLLAGLHFLVGSVYAANLRAQPQTGTPAPQVNVSGQVRAVNISEPGLDTKTVSMLFSGRSTRQTPQVAPPHLFVAVFTTRATPIEKRNSIRQLWTEVDGGPGNICARFALCQRVDAYEAALQAEQVNNGDLLFLPCEEGYAQGLLTRKVVAVMRAYHAASTTKDACLNRPLFMKVDDDTFVGGYRFRQGLGAASSMYGELMYAGVDLPSQPPERNPASQWYEPLAVWPHPNYPPAMYGGPGYILGRQMIARIIDEGIADQYILWNEDRAVGVWVNALQQRGVFINWVRIPGTNGFHWDHPVKTGAWGQYPYVLSHHLSASCILCLMNVDRANNPTVLTDPCFSLDPLPEPVR